MLVMECSSFCPFIAIDMEFPGCLVYTPENAPDSVRYADMKVTVDNTQPLQLGLTLFDSHSRIWGSWQVNFSGFRETEDASNADSVAFLRRKGLDFEKMRNHGVPIDCFFHGFLHSLIFQRNLTWVTFHGNFDIAYLVKMLTRSPLPATSREFAEIVGNSLGTVYDVKTMAGRIHGLGDRLGLEKVASRLGAIRVGSAHHAGSDSLLTACSLILMAPLCNSLSELEGLVYGISPRIVSRRPVILGYMIG
ncbi:PREDICTED: putative CCR4-associated factor 1 homolog 8 [Tarenaya hassleriana]|uniref:putative CCR4-associated factor 1 homolog 8 n=1 Tax=Tarenaya hassleriana TaxID=28532 RepID=UPI0008FCE813|nr:PREDICTED: putative CCR4-associated factor 1 homolog 8 [Tarenaya hassleriana]